MIISCPACATRYVVPDTAIGVDGRTVRCAKCRHSWFQEGPELVTAATAARAVGSAARTAPPPPAADPPRAESPRTEAPASPRPEPTPPAPRPEPEVVAAAASAAAVSETQYVAEPEPALADEPLGRRRRHEPVYDSAGEDDEESAFSYEPPFRRRRNWARMWTFAASLFAIISLGLVGAVAWYGMPDWMPLSRPLFAEAQPDLIIEFPPDKQDRRTLPNGTAYFGASGTVTNVGQTRRTVPMILIVLRDVEDRIVYTQPVAPPKRQLGPGESVTINEALTDVPNSAKYAEFGWKPG